MEGREGVRSTERPPECADPKRSVGARPRYNEVTNERS